MNWYDDGQPVGMASIGTMYLIVSPRSDSFWAAEADWISKDICRETKELCDCCVDATEYDGADCLLAAATTELPWDRREP